MDVAERGGLVEGEQVGFGGGGAAAQDVVGCAEWEEDLRVGYGGTLWVREPAVLIYYISLNMGGDGDK